MDILSTIVNENGRSMCQQQMSGAKRWVHRSWRKSWRIWMASLRRCSLFHADFDITDILKMLGLGDASRGDRNLEEAFAQDCDSWPENNFRALPSGWSCLDLYTLKMFDCKARTSGFVELAPAGRACAPAFPRISCSLKKVSRPLQLCSCRRDTYMSSIRQMLYSLQDVSCINPFPRISDQKAVLGSVEDGCLLQHSTAFHEFVQWILRPWFHIFVVCYCQTLQFCRSHLQFCYCCQQSYPPLANCNRLDLKIHVAGLQSIWPNVFEKAKSTGCLSIFPIHYPAK